MEDDNALSAQPINNKSFVEQKSVVKVAHGSLESSIGLLDYLTSAAFRENLPHPNCSSLGVG